MIINTTGQICKNFYVLGNMGYPMFLMDAPRPVIFEAGVCFAGEIYARDIRSILGPRQPSMLFLTHAHWDHCAATSHLKKVFPEMKVAMSQLAGETLKRPNALALIQKLNEGARIAMSAFPGVDSSQFISDPFQPFDIDIELQDNAVMDLGDGITVQVLATPGHTRDHHSFWFPQEKILVAGEAAGLLGHSGDVSTEFLFSYDTYLSSLQRLAELPVEIFCQGHGLVIVGKDEIRHFFERSITETILFKNRLFEMLDEEGGDLERVAQKAKKERWDPIKGIKQPEVTYMINLRAQVAHMAAVKASS